MRNLEPGMLLRSEAGIFIFLLQLSISSKFYWKVMVRDPENCFTGLREIYVSSDASTSRWKEVKKT